MEHLMRSLAHVAVLSLAALAIAACADLDPVVPLKPAAAEKDISEVLPPILKPVIPTLPQGSDVADITAGANHTCVRTYDGAVYCWGRDDHMQSGTFTKSPCDLLSGSKGVTCIHRPTLVNMQSRETGASPLNATRIDAGANHTCIIDPVSEVWCWGDGDDGQLGISVFSSAMEPQKVSGGEKFTDIGAGQLSTCAAGPGGVFCWGTLVGRAPDPVLVDKRGTHRAITVGEGHACLLNDGHRTECMGNNSLGQLGVPRTTVTSIGFFTPTDFGDATNITTQMSFTCSDQYKGTVQCSGENGYGQLGNGIRGGTFASIGVPQLVGGGAELHSVTTGNYHACALDAGGAAWCWGNGFAGQVGNGAQALFPSPQLVNGGHTYRAIAAGDRHTCAIGTDNRIYCWGLNNMSQLGIGAWGGTFSDPVQALDPSP
jgi:alpha-tubulin suppressor-like RCC1 family protein